jgi:hypothetical protein
MGLGLGNLDFFGPILHSPNGSMPFHKAQKSLGFQGLDPPANTSMVTSSLTRGVSSGKSIFTLVVDLANHKFAKRARPVCMPGLPYKDSPVFSRI